MDKPFLAAELVDLDCDGRKDWRRRLDLTASPDTVVLRAAGPDGKPGITERIYSQLQNIDQMPVTGSVLTHSLRSLVPDSASAASAWSTGDKTLDGASGVRPNETDCHLRANFGPDGLQWAADNPRIETLSELLKRTRGYRTGVVTTAYVADATPASISKIRFSVAPLRCECRRQRGLAYSHV